jgi:prepilin-type N-terminal cleavage/methylation domain-containing protein
MKKGFTLAEVLITLAILGFVASLTIPSVVKNYRATQLESQFKKTYSSASQATMKIMVEEGGAVYDFDNDVNDFRNKFMSYFSVIDDCKTTCFSSSNYKSYTKGSAQTYFFARSFIVKDGTY